jgi:TatD DNase family protein
MSLLWIDSHFHPQWLLQAEDGKDTQADFESSIAQISQGLMVSVGLGDRLLLEALAQKHTHLQWSLGVHPCYTEGIDPEELRSQLLLNPSYHALGETGLDCYHSKEPKLLAQQHVCFEVHMECARALRKPLIIHTRDAGDATLAVLSRYPGVRGVIHCFTESMDFARAVFDLGWMISLSGILTFPKAQFLRDIASYAPLDRLLIETDAPYLAPSPYRGKANQPHYVQYVGKMLSELKGLSIEDCQRQIASNYQAFLEINQ